MPDPDISQLLSRAPNAKTVTLIFERGSQLTAVNYDDGTMLTGHVGSWPDRYCASVLISERGKAFRKAMKRATHKGFLIIEAYTEHPFQERDDQGTPFTLYPARFVNP